MKTNSMKVAEIIITHISILTNKGYATAFDNGREQGYTIHHEGYSVSVAESRNSDQIVVFTNEKMPFGDTSEKTLFHFGDYKGASDFIIKYLSL